MIISTDTAEKFDKIQKFWKILIKFDIFEKSLGKLRRT